MKNKRNSVSSLFLACALFANYGFATTKVDTTSVPLATFDDSSIVGTLYSESSSGDVTAFSYEDLYYNITTKSTLTVVGTSVVSSSSGAVYVTVTYSDGSTDWQYYSSQAEYEASSNVVSSSTVVSTGYYEVPLYNTYTEVRDIEYTFDTGGEVSSTTYVTDPEGNVSEFWGWRDELSETVDTDGDVISYTNSNGYSISISEYNTYYFEREETYFVIEATNIDLDVTAIAEDGNATALDFTGLVTYYEDDSSENKTSESTITTNGITNGISVSTDNYTLAFTEIFTGAIDIDATAIATGGNATAIKGYIEHTSFDVNLADTGWVSLDNGNLTLNLNASATATSTYDATTDTVSWTGGSAIGMQYVDETNNGSSTTSYTDFDGAFDANGSTPTSTGDVESGNVVTTEKVVDGNTTTTTVTIVTYEDGASVSTYVEETKTENTNNGIDKVLFADNGTSTVDITAIAKGAGDDISLTDDDYIGAFGIIGDVYVETGTVNVSAYAYAINDYKYGADAVDGTASGSAIAIDGEVEFVGTNVNLTAYSESAYATAVGDKLTLTEGANLTATVVGYDAVGIEDAEVYNSTLTVNVSAIGEADEDAGTVPSAVGANDVSIVDSILTLNVSSESEDATVIGATTIELLGTSTLNLTAISLEGEVTGVTNLNIGYKSDEDTVSATIYAQGTSATGVENLGNTDYKNSIHSLNTILDVTAVATGSDDTSSGYNAKAVGIASDIIFSDDENYEVESLAANVSAIASYANEEVEEVEDIIIVTSDPTATPATTTVDYTSTVNAVAVDGEIGIYVDDGNGNLVVGGVKKLDEADEDDYIYTLSITGSYVASATASSLNDTATATATAINGNIFANVFGDITALASATSEKGSASATATGVSGTLYGDISGSISAEAKAKISITEDAGDETNTVTYTSSASAIAISGDVDDGDISGSVSAYAQAEASIGTDIMYTEVDTSATAIAIDGDVTGNISGTVSAIAIGSQATAITGTVIGDISGTVFAGATSTADSDDASATAINKISSDDSDSENIIYSSISGSVVATATTSGIDANATATAIDEVDSDMEISGAISASATATGEGATATATAINITEDDLTLTFDSATITASADGETSTSTAINADTNNFTVVGDLTASGDIIADTITLGKTEIVYDEETGMIVYDDEGEIVYKEFGASINQVSGTLNADIDVSNAASSYALGFNVYGNLPNISGSVNYSYAKDTETQSAALSSLLTATAAALVGDNDTIENISFDGTALSDVVSDLLEEDEDAIAVKGNNSLDYSLSLTEEEDGSVSVTATVDKTTYFQDKVGTSNAGTIAKFLDSIELVVTDEPYASAEVLEEIDAINLENRTFKEKLDGMELDSFVPHANSFIAQVNAETFSNLSVANVWRMRSLMSEASKTAREKAADAIMANPEFDGEDPDPTAKPKRVAQFQSVNMIGSRDGGSNAPDYDFISTGGTADMDFFFGKDLVVGVGVGSVYNKVDADISSVGTAESTSFIVNSYAMWSKDDFEAFGTLGYAHSFNESKKSTTEGTEKGDWDSDSIYNLAGVTYSVDFENGLILRPMAMYSLVYQQYNGYKTKGTTSYGTSIDSKSYVNFKTMIGAELVYSITKEFEMIARLFWTHEFIDNSYDSTYTNDLLSSYMGTLSYNGEEADRDTLLAGLGLAYRFENGISAYLDYNANVSGDYLGHNLNAALQVKF